MTYASSHEKEIPHRSLRRRMEVLRALHQGYQQTRTSEDIQFAPCPRRHLLRLKEWLPLEAIAPRVPPLESCLLLVQEMAHRRHLRTVKCGVARAPARALGEKCPTPSAGIVDSQCANTT